MTELILLLCVLISLIITLLFGNIVYKIENKKNINFFNVFPFELESKNDVRLTFFYRIFLSLFIISCCVDGLYLFFFHYDSYFTSKFLGGIFILSCLMNLGMNLISTKIYKGHIVISSLFFTLNFSSYVLLGIVTLINKFDSYPLWLSIVSFIISGILLIMMFSPVLKNWFKLDVNETEVKRKKFNLFVFTEWINIFISVLFLILVTIIYM